MSQDGRGGTIDRLFGSLLPPEEGSSETMAIAPRDRSADRSADRPYRVDPTLAALQKMIAPVALEEVRRIMPDVNEELWEIKEKKLRKQFIQIIDQTIADRLTEREGQRRQAFIKTFFTQVIESLERRQTTLDARLTEAIKVFNARTAIGEHPEPPIRETACDDIKLMLMSGNQVEGQVSPRGRFDGKVCQLSNIHGGRTAYIGIHQMLVPGIITQRERAIAIWEAMEVTLKDALRNVPPSPNASTYGRMLEAILKADERDLAKCDKDDPDRRKERTIVTFHFPGDIKLDEEVVAVNNFGCLITRHEDWVGGNGSSLADEDFVTKPPTLAFPGCFRFLPWDSFLYFDIDGARNNELR